MTGSVSEVMKQSRNRTNIPHIPYEIADSEQVLLFHASPHDKYLVPRSRRILSDKNLGQTGDVHRERRDSNSLVALEIVCRQTIRKICTDDIFGIDVTLSLSRQSSLYARSSSVCIYLICGIRVWGTSSSPLNTHVFSMHRNGMSVRYVYRSIYVRPAACYILSTFFKRLFHYA